MKLDSGKGQNEILIRKKRILHDLCSTAGFGGIHG
jgi:hypothetical protein